MIRVKDWLGKYLFPGSGRHAVASVEITPVVDDFRRELAEASKPPPGALLDPYTAGENWRLQHTEAEHAAAADAAARAPWTRPLIGGGDD